MTKKELTYAEKEKMVWDKGYTQGWYDALREATKRVHAILPVWCPVFVPDEPNEKI